MTKIGPTADRPAERVLTRPCGYCGDPFIPIRRHQRYCRPSCRRAAFLARHEQARDRDGDRLAVLFE